ncbi:hypothetical protein [Georgenia alba]|uniref:DUF4245 family protein n=1 Tax=Georgenia alba TaxID=2233858 RepID=A0ABW2Q3J9_9MICO
MISVVAVVVVLAVVVLLVRPGSDSDGGIDAVEPTVPHTVGEFELNEQDSSNYYADVSPFPDLAWGGVFYYVTSEQSVFVHLWGPTDDIGDYTQYQGEATAVGSGQCMTDPGDGTRICAVNRGGVVLTAALMDEATGEWLTDDARLMEITEEFAAAMLG